MTKRKVNVWMEFGHNTLSVIAFSLGKTDLDPANVTDDEVVRFLIHAAEFVTESNWDGWLANGGEEYEQKTTRS